MPFGFYYYWDPTWLLLIPALILAIWAQAKVSSTFTKYARIASQRGLSGAQVAESILHEHNVYDVRVEPTQGHLSDHYDPRRKVLRLSNEVYSSSSLAALGVAAHEVGHALQHAEGYAPLKWRSLMVPVAQFGSMLAFPLLFLGLILNTDLLIQIGIYAFAAAVLFQLVTLPVEFNASSRAIEALEAGAYLSREETVGSRQVLSAAAMTYVASTVMAVLQLLRLLLLSSRRR